jgi:hypothetical protein
MGQHKYNPTALAAARGELSKADRVRTAKTPTHTERLIEPGTRYRFSKSGGLVRKFPKVRGKANVKRAKKARRLAREWAAAQKAA